MTKQSFKQYVEHLPRQPKCKGLSPATATGTSGEKGGGELLNVKKPD